MQVLYVAVAGWLVMVSRGGPRIAGHGLVMAIFGAHAILLADFTRERTGLPDLVTLVSVTGWTAYALGLCLTAWLVVRVRR